MPGTWSYDPTDLATTPKDVVRFLIQDTQTTRQLMFDEEITWALTQFDNVYSTAASCCDILVARGGNIKSKTVGDLSITYDVGFYRSLAADLRARGMTNQMPYAGGISITDKLAVQANPDWVPPAISRGLDNNPAAPQPETPSVNPLTTI